MNQNVSLKFYTETIPDKTFFNAEFDFLELGDDTFIKIRQKETNEFTYFRLNDIFSIETEPMVP